MPTQDYDESLWETTDGLGLDNETATITKMSFLVDNKYKAGAIVAKITWQPEVGDAKDEIYPVGGREYENVDGGDRLTTGDGSAPKMNKQSKFGKFITSVAKIGANAEIGDPFYAPNWVGTTWVVFREPFSIQFKDRPDKVEGTAVLVREFIGRARASKAKGTAKKAAVKAAEPVVEDVNEDVISRKLAVQLKALLEREDVTDEDSFLEAAFELDGVKGVTPVQNVLVDGYYEALVEQEAA